MTCEWASCTADATNHEAGWDFCPKHLTLHVLLTAEANGERRGGRPRKDAPPPLLSGEDYHRAFLAELANTA